MLKNPLFRKMLQSQLKGIPESEREKIIAVVEKNPELFQTIAAEAQQKRKEGKDQQTAIMEVMKNHEEELKKAMEV